MTSEDGHIFTDNSGTVAECVCRHTVYAFDIFSFLVLDMDTVLGHKSFWVGGGGLPGWI